LRTLLLAEFVVRQYRNRLADSQVMHGRGHPPEAFPATATEPAGRALTVVASRVSM
jgi:hypothetical protein